MYAGQYTKNYNSGLFQLLEIILFRKKMYQLRTSVQLLTTPAIKLNTSILQNGQCSFSE